MLLKNYEQSVISNKKARLKMVLLYPCDWARQIEVPKELNYVTLEGLESMNKIVENKLDVLNSLALENVISITKTSDQNEIVQGFGLRTTRLYKIELTANGVAANVGETGDNYLLNLLDFDHIEILNEDKITSDTISVNYSISPTLVFTALKKYCTSNPPKYVENYNNNAKIYLDNNEWRVLEE